MVNEEKKLKTLKNIIDETHWTDITYHYDNQHPILAETLQESAREWIKEIEEDEGFYLDNFEKALLPGLPPKYKIRFNPIQESNVIKWIKHFFNLEEP